MTITKTNDTVTPYINSLPGNMNRAFYNSVLSLCQQIVQRAKTKFRFGGKKIKSSQDMLTNRSGSLLNSIGFIISKAGDGFTGAVQYLTTARSTTRTKPYIYGQILARRNAAWNPIQRASDEILKSQEGRIRQDIISSIGGR